MLTSLKANKNYTIDLQNHELKTIVINLCRNSSWNMEIWKHNSGKHGTFKFKRWENHHAIGDFLPMHEPWPSREWHQNCHVGVSLVSSHTYAKMCWWTLNFTQCFRTPVNSTLERLPGDLAECLFTTHRFGWFSSWFNITWLTVIWNLGWCLGGSPKDICGLVRSQKKT